MSKAHLNLLTPKGVHVAVDCIQNVFDYVEVFQFLITNK